MTVMGEKIADNEDREQRSNIEIPHELKENAKQWEQCNKQKQIEQ